MPLNDALKKIALESGLQEQILTENFNRGTVAAVHGADFLCYVTPSEHLGLPDVEDVRLGVLAARIAGHAADLVKRRPGAWEWDEKMSRGRKSRDWAQQIQLALDPDLARDIRRRTCREDHETCTMCGDLCAYKADAAPTEDFAAGEGPARLIDSSQ